MFDTQMAEKKRIEEGASALARKMKQASDLINGLAGSETKTLCCTFDVCVRKKLIQKERYG